MTKLDPAEIKRRSANSLVETLGLEILEAGEKIARGRLVVAQRHLAPNGYLHAASVVALADTCCGYGTYADLPEGAAGFTTAELKSNHMGTLRAGTLCCEATAQHQGRTTQVWDARIFAEDRPEKTIALFRCTQIVLWP